MAPYSLKIEAIPARLTGRRPGDFRTHHVLPRIVKNPAQVSNVTDRASLIARQLAPLLAPGQTLLEIGAGKGHVARALKQASGADIHLVDVVDYNETDLDLQVYDGTHLPFGDRSFDHALLVFVLHHTPDPLVVLAEALRVSRCGVIVVENDVEGRLRQALTRAVDSIPHWQHGVPICYHAQTIREWQALFERLPVRVQLLSRFQVGWFWSNFVMRVERT